MATLNNLDAEQVTAMHEDLVILVDKSDTPIGHASKLESHVSPGMLHRAFSVLMFNSRGQMLLQRRSASKITFPGLLSNACCSHQLFNERSQGDGVAGSVHAAVRRVAYELNMSILPCELTFIGKLLYHADSVYIEQCKEHFCEYEMDHIFFCYVDSELPTPNSSEVNELVWVSRSDCLSQDGSIWPQLTPWFKLILTLIISDLWAAIELRGFKPAVEAYCSTRRDCIVDTLS